MSIEQRLIAGLASLVIIVFIIDLVRRRKLREEYSLLWLGACVVMIGMIAYDKAVYVMARVLGIEHAAYSLFVLALFVGMVLAIHFTLVLSKLTAQIWRLTQEIGLLQSQIDEMRKTGHSLNVLAGSSDAGPAAGLRS